MLSLVFALASVLSAGVPADGENLQYTINWPSGLSLGEARLKVAKAQDNWTFEFQFEASLPGFVVSDTFSSQTDAAACSVSFLKDLQHGKRKTKEKITFEPKGGNAERETIGGGKSQFDAPACAKDALAFLFHVRKELGQGRIPPAQNVYYGSPYRVRLEFKGTQMIKVGEAMENADKVSASVKGPSSAFDVDMFFAKDENRTPLAVKVALPVGQFTMELVR